MYPAEVVVLGGGVVGTNAARIAMGMGARVTILDLSHARLQYLDDVFQGRITTMMSTEPNIRELITRADLVIGSVLVPGAKTPKLVTRDMLPVITSYSIHYTKLYEARYQDAFSPHHLWFLSYNFV